MEKILTYIVLLIVIQTSVMANEEKNLDYVCVINYNETENNKYIDQKIYESECVSTKELKKILKQKSTIEKNGYFLVEYKKQQLVYLNPLVFEQLKNKCKKTQAVFYVQP